MGAPHNNKENENDIAYNIYVVLSFAASAFLALTSSVWVYLNIQNKINGLPQYMDIAVMVMCLVLCYLMVDFKNGALINIWAKKTAKNEQYKGVKKDAARWVSRMVMITLVLRLGTSVGLTYNVSPDIGEEISGNDDTKFYIEQFTSIEKERQNERKDNVELFNKLTKSEEKRIKDAEQKGKELIEEAITGGKYWNRWREKSYNEQGIDKPHAWLVNKSNPDKGDHYYADAIKKARKDAADLVIKEKEKITTLLPKKDTISKIDAILDIAKIEQGKFIEKTIRHTNAIYLFDFFAIVALLFSEFAKANIEMLEEGQSAAGGNIFSTTLSGIKSAFSGILTLYPNSSTETTATETVSNSSETRRMAGFRYGETTATATGLKSNYNADSNRNTTATETQNNRNRNTETTATATVFNSSETRICQHCKSSIPKSKSTKARYCSERCKNDAYLERRKNKIG